MGWGIARGHAVSIDGVGGASDAEFKMARKISTRKSFRGTTRFEATLAHRGAASRAPAARSPPPAGGGGAVGLHSG